MSGATTQAREGEDTSADDTQAQEILAEAVEEQQEVEGTETTDSGGSGSGDDAKPADAKPAGGAKAAADTVDRAELNKVIKERQDAKRALRDAQQQLDEIKRANEGETERAQREAREQATSEVEGKYKPLVVRTSATAALVSAGVPADKTDRMVRLMNLDDIEVTGSGEVQGVDAQVNQLKEDYPELFAQPEPPRRKAAGAKAADGADKPPTQKKLTTEQQIMKRLRGEQ